MTCIWILEYCNDLPARNAADAESPFSFHSIGDGEALSEGADEVETVAGLFQGQDLRALAGDLEKELDAAGPGVVDAQGSAEEGKGPVGDFDHDELPRPRFPPDVRGVDRQIEVIVPVADLAEAGVPVYRHGSSGAWFAP